MVLYGWDAGSRGGVRARTRTTGADEFLRRAHTTSTHTTSTRERKCSNQGDRDSNGNCKILPLCLGGLDVFARW